MSEKSLKQERIADWFNQTYLTRGELYLRPLVAYQVFCEMTPYTKSSKVLDIACGLGRLLTAFETEVNELHGIDISEIAVQKAQSLLPSAQIKCGNAEQLPYQDNYFNIITCIGSLERIIDLNLALEEQKRVSTKNAHFCFMVRNSKTLSWHIKSFFGIQNKKGHQQAKSLNEWSKIFENSDFSILNIHPDPWPVNRFFWWLSLRGLIPLPFKKVRKSLLPLKYANEFIFILQKRRDE